jgi:LysM repeat protein
VFARIVIVLVAAVVLWAALVRDTGAGGHRTYYRVQAGDTLWSIAIGHVGGDAREGVWRIQQANDLEGSTIVPGQRLVMP